ncbi:hypothetical protein H2200_006445 [Cladophialophora chaetospira]|uniref:Uncharacterized protein n=1 Tax=Cladophialophora chaetospira TaxID=386627 RepID=A0AA38X8E1_9EURO|nr:hypothetical protein H2200_006445 [Cladophialophora chaetospira]
MTTTMIVQTDIERAVVPADIRQNSELPVSVVLFSARMIRSLRSLHHNLTLLRIVKFSVGALVGTLSLMSAWWALDLAMWTSVKDFREDCREQLQNFNFSSSACQEVLSRPLRQPPTWRGYLEKATETISRRNKRYRYQYDGEDFAATPEHPRRFLASRAPATARPIPHYECNEYWELPITGISKQSDAQIMYGGMPSAGSLSAFHPLSQGCQEAFDDFWEYFEVERPCKIWLNATGTGAVQEIQTLFIPDQRAEPEAFEEVLELMPPELRSERRWWCSYPPVSEAVPVNARIGIGTDMLKNIDNGAALALTFILVAYGHEIIYGGFARKTRWKWQ